DARRCPDGHGNRRHRASRHRNRMGRQFPNARSETARNSEGRVRLLFALLLAAAPLHFDVTDARGKKPAGVSIESGDADEDGWYALKAVAKGKGTPVLVWPFDGRAKAADGPGDIPAIVIESGDARAANNARVIAAIAAGQLLGARVDTGIVSL